MTLRLTKEEINEYIREKRSGVSTQSINNHSSNSNLHLIKLERLDQLPL